MPLSTSPRLIAFCVASFSLQLAPCAFATDETESPPRNEPIPLQEVTVTAAPLAETGDELIQPSAVISGSQLDDRRGATIGETVNQIPGVQSSYFGAGVGRPIIRGLEGTRVQVLEGGISSLDLSGASNDHAVTIDPFLADQVEVLKGPSTLLYGAGAIGGVVNVVDGRIPEKPIDGIHGRVQWSGNTVNDERNGVARVDAGNGDVAIHADYVRRSADDYEIPGGGTLFNSDVSTRASAFGVGYTGAQAFAGISVSQLKDHYGIPVGPSREPLDPDLETIRLDLNQTRIDAKAGLVQPWSWLERVTLRVGHNDYQHTEHAAGEVDGTLFKNNGYEMRLEVIHTPIGPWHGAFGLQYGNRDFSAIGEETIVPNTNIRERGVFVVEQATFDPVTLQLGTRLDKSALNPDGRDGIEFTARSLSAGAIWKFSDQWHLALNLDSAQRAPDESSLFVNGPHDATGSFEIGDPTLRKETSNQVDMALHFHSDVVQASLGVYTNRFDDFIYLAETGDEAEGFPVREWSQHNARFRGMEGEAKVRLAQDSSGRFDVRMFGDTVRAELTDDAGNLPRIAPARFGASVLWSLDQWRASLGAIRYARQDRLAAFETPTNGYTTINAHLSYTLASGPVEWEMFLDGTNLSDQEARAATSFLKDRAPLPGRAISFGVRTFF
ncbi:MAG: TonB-dependent receptor [Tahibacter sp.]